MGEKVRAHFIGIGGAGMSGIALVLHERGVRVTGSDLKESRYSRMLKERGVEVHVGHGEANLGDPEVVVVSTAIPESNPELRLARERGIEVWPRARMLAELADDRLTVAVAGTHGKTSTSSMCATMLDRMGLSPTFLIGGEVDGYGTNAVNGDGPHFVVEADESDGSFLYLDPHVALVTNVEADHLDHYGSIEDIEEVFDRFMRSVGSGGRVVVCGDDPRALRLARECGRDMVTYGFGSECDITCAVQGREGIASMAQVTFPEGLTLDFMVRVPGDHMVVNATGVLATAWHLGVDLQAAARALSRFTGVRRRFDQVGVARDVTVVDDYAHHPTEVAATVRAASRLGFGRVHVLFQPHRYSRTKAFVEEFAEAFSLADSVTFMDVYSAGEAPIPGVWGKTLVDAVLRHDPRANVAWMPHRGEIAGYLERVLRPGDLLITMGAGDVTAMGPVVLEALRGSEGAAG